MSALAGRPFNAYLSYSHKDRQVADSTLYWLTKCGGFNIWFDETHLDAGAPVAARLAEHMAACRNLLALASENSMASPWVKAELEQALDFGTRDPDFKLLVLKLDDCSVERTWPAISRFKWLEMPGGSISQVTAREVINCLDGRASSESQPGQRDVYVSRGWRPADLPFGDAVCRRLGEPVLEASSDWRLGRPADVFDRSYSRNTQAAADTLLHPGAARSASRRPSETIGTFHPKSR